jgi:hypothetical protein
MPKNRRRRHPTKPVRIDLGIYKEVEKFARGKEPEVSISKAASHLLRKGLQSERPNSQ